MTVGLAVCALIVGLALAMFFAVWESAKWRPVAWAGSALVTILRGLPEILVVLFIYFGSSQLLLTLSDGFTINLGFVQIPVQMDIENSTLARSFVVSSLCHCCMPPMPRKRFGAR